MHSCTRTRTHTHTHNAVQCIHWMCSPFFLMQSYTDVETRYVSIVHKRVTTLCMYVALAVYYYYNYYNYILCIPSKMRHQTNIHHNYACIGVLIWLNWTACMHIIIIIIFLESFASSHSWKTRSLLACSKWDTLYICYIQLKLNWAQWLLYSFLALSTHSYIVIMQVVNTVHHWSHVVHKTSTCAYGSYTIVYHYNIY